MAETRHDTIRPSGGDARSAPVLSQVEARQAVTGHHVRYVLYYGTGAVIVAFAVIYLIFFAR